MSGLVVLDSERLRLTAMGADALGAWIDGDARALLNLTGARFDLPVDAPPLFGEDLPGFRDRMVEDPDELGWWVWLVTRKDDGLAVGVCGLSGKPDEDGVADLGYAVYPRWEGRGYATESSNRLVSWILEHPSARCVRVTVPLRNTASVAVARKLGMTEAARGQHPEVGEVAVYELTDRTFESMTGDP
jgi:RimJ/RimL family protein N-acetyltransferase